MTVMRTGCQSVGWSLVVMLMTTGATFAQSGASSPRGDPTYGSHAVGVRIEPTRDLSRRLGPATDFEGHPIPGALEWPVQVVIWYPASAPSASVMTEADYRRLAASAEQPTDVRDDGAAPALADVRQLGTMVLGRALSDDEARQVLAVRGRASRDAAPAPERFPLIVGGLGSTATGWSLGEYLASHGYVVVTAPALGKTVTAEAAQPAIALESQARTMEYLLAQVYERPFVDVGRVGLLGVNFDGAAALVVQSRAMQARALVSIDGVEGKGHGPGILAASPWFDPIRIRVPYLTVQWDEPTFAPLDYTTFDSLKYAERRSLVIRDLGHLELVGNLLPWPGLDADTREGYGLLFDTVRAFLDTHVKGTALAAPVATAGRLRDDRSARALPPAPTPDELERIIWQQRDVARGVAAIRAALAANPGARVIDGRTLALYAFRYEQIGQREHAAALRALAAELSPPSSPRP